MEEEVDFPKAKEKGNFSYKSYMQQKELEEKEEKEYGFSIIEIDDD